MSTIPDWMRAEATLERAAPKSRPLVSGLTWVVIVALGAFAVLALRQLIG